MNSKEENTLRRLRGRDRSALAELYDAHSPRVFSLLAERSDRGAASEMLSNVFIKLWHAPDEARKAASIESWLLQTARKTRSVARPLAPSNKPGRSILPQAAPVTNLQRRLISDTYFRGLNVEDAATNAGIDPAAARRRLVDAMRRLKSGTGAPEYLFYDEAEHGEYLPPDGFEAIRSSVKRGVEAGAQAGFAMVRAETHDYAEAVYTFGYSERFAGAVRHVDISTELPAVEALRTGAIITLSDVTEAVSRFPAIATLQAETGFQAFAVAPVPFPAGSQSASAVVGFSFDEKQDFVLPA